MPCCVQVKTTTPRKYVVRPSSGIVEPKTTANVQVIMQDINQETFKATGHKDTRIRVILEGPPAPPSPVPEVNENEDESTKSEKDTYSTQPAAPAPLRAVEEPAALSSENKTLRAQIEKLTSERDELRRKLESAARGKGPAAQATIAATSPLSLLPVIMVGIIAFLVGHFLQKLTR
eukprot:jgi/Chrzof1/4044/Cz13g18090.t1